jgi:hypothetical protein
VKAKPVVLTALVTAALTLVPVANAYASCSLAAEKVTSASRVVEDEAARLAEFKPGADSRDAAWLKDNVVAMVPDWLPTTRAFVTRSKPEIDRLVDDCYRPGDYGVAGPVRFEFIACAKKAAMAQVISTRPTEWSDVCGEVTASLDDPAFENRLSTWTRGWVDAYVKDVQARPVR